MGRFDGDFIPTISDSDDDVPNLDSEEEQSAVEEASKPVSVEKKNTKKKSKKVAEQPKDDEEAENAAFNNEFTFDVDGGEAVADFDGWDFKGDEKTGYEKKDVDLDGIIRRRGGLGQLAGSKQDVDEDSEDEESDEDNDEEEGEGSDEDDEDLALDGFGMGINRKAADDNEEDKESDEEEGSDEEEEDQTKVLEAGSDIDEDHEDEDSEEAQANFYAPTEESEEARKNVHKDFLSLDLSRPVIKGITALGYTKPTPIQNATIPIALLGKDIIAGAVTGSGKTAAYMIPVIERLLFKPAKIASTRVVVLTPTRELAIQVGDVGKKLGKFISNVSFGLAVGGLNLRQQEQELKQRPDVVIATPGRIIDHLRNSPSFNVDDVEILIIDEADRMLEEGFQKELTEILEILPTRRQTLLFSATMNSKIKSLVQLSLKRPVRVMIDPPKQAATGLVQEFVRIRKRNHLKPSVLFNILKKFSTNQRIVIFVARKDMAHKLRIILGLLGLKVSELHGALTQEQRLQSINNFKSLIVPILICTDLASRGLDIPKIEVVINFDMPKNFEVYLHRVGRTARGGREGKSISFVGEAGIERAIVKEAIKSAENNPNHKIAKTVGREVNWPEVEEISKIIEAKSETVEEILVEEKSEKEMLQAEMEVRKGENFLRYKDEINSRPKRTWFEKESEKGKPSIESQKLKILAKNKKVNSKKRKQQEARDELGARSYKKTKTDRMTSQKRTQKKGKGKKK